jgi:hypothetical protein
MQINYSGMDNIKIGIHFFYGGDYFPDFISRDAVLIAMTDSATKAESCIKNLLPVYNDSISLDATTKDGIHLKPNTKIAGLVLHDFGAPFCFPGGGVNTALIRP